MRLVIDMQGAQSGSRLRGIGRYSIELVKAILNNRGNHEVILALSDLFPETIEPIREMFYDLIPQNNIRVWEAPGPTREIDAYNGVRQQVAGRIREAFLESLQPDIVLLTSLFEGFVDDAVTSVRLMRFPTSTAIILYDLIPFINPENNESQIFRNWYNKKIEYLKKASLLLAISESSRQEALEYLNFEPQKVVTISGGVGRLFRKFEISDQERQMIFNKFNIQKPFIMYTGGADERKNLHRLVKAFHLLPQSVQNQFQLVFVGDMPLGHVEDLKRIAKKNSLPINALLFTEYVDDNDLLKLYNLCSLFVFPSLHEGLGFPPLEAMACGAPVIGSDRTSLKEVIGKKEAFFDPFSEESISKKIFEVLSNESLKQNLIEHGLSHVKNFTWNRTAQTALEALEKFSIRRIHNSETRTKVLDTSLNHPQIKKVLVIKLDHLGDFILAVPALRKLRSLYPTAKIDALVGSWNLPIARELGIFENVYTFDYFKAKSSLPPEFQKKELENFVTTLGVYDLAIDLRRQPETRFILKDIKSRIKAGYSSFDREIDRKIDICLPSFRDISFEKIMHNEISTAIQMFRIIEALPSDNAQFFSSINNFREQNERKISIGIFPFAGTEIKEWGIENYRKLIERLSQESSVDSINIYLISKKDQEKLGLFPFSKTKQHVGLSINELMESLKENILCVANNSGGGHLASYLGLSVIGVYGGQETPFEWGPVFGSNTILYKNINCSPCHLSSPLACPHGLSCWDIPVESVYEKIMKTIVNYINKVDNDSEKFKEPLEFLTPKDLIESLISSIQDIDSSPLSLEETRAIANSISISIPRERIKNIFVDISELVVHDANTGIQRVVRSILWEWFNHPPIDYRIEPVYSFSDDKGYRYAHSFVMKNFDKKNYSNSDEFIDFSPGDIFFGLDFSPAIVNQKSKYFQRLRRKGVKVFFMVYDLLPIQFPHFFSPGIDELFLKWLKIVTENDGAICISKSVADQLEIWMKNNDSIRFRPFEIFWTHLGVDFIKNKTEKSQTNEIENFFNLNKNRILFLMVGTLEPRKGHAEVLKAFEMLWNENKDIILLIVGKKGWLVDPLIDRIKNHSELNKRLFWLQGINDDELEIIYKNSSCLIAASKEEGFGLPLVEAAKYKLPILTRDIPVFREICGENAYYFSSEDSNSLAKKISEWIILFRTGKFPKSEFIKFNSWEKTANEMLLNLSLNK